MSNTPTQRTRRILLAGFGGLLALMAFAGLDTLRMLRAIQDRNEAIRSGFLTRNRLLNLIRSDLYLSGTYVRDYLLEPDQRKAESSRASLQQSRGDMELALRRYAGLLSESDRQPFASLESQLSQYWKILDPVVQWDGDLRKTRGYPFLRDEVYPRRTAMLGLADEIGMVNERQSDDGDNQVRELFSGFRIRLGFVLFITLGLGILLTVYSMSRILRLEREADLRFAEIAQARTELKQLSARLVAVQESERRAISRELHDEVGQSLSALGVGLGNLAGRYPELAGEIEALRAMAAASVGVVRNMTLLLRPSMLDDLGLVPALRWQAREVSKRSGVAVNITGGDDVAADLPDEHKTAVYRVVQEALHNCEKHGKAKEIRVTVLQRQSELLLSIQDDGCGFQRNRERGLGLLGMQERIENLGGMFNVESEPGRGSLITVRLPLA